MNNEVLDVKEFLERVQDDKELLLELLDIYTDDYKAKQEPLNKAIKTNNFEEVRNIAHSLKGASGNISAKQMRQIFFVMEEMGKNNNLTGINELVEKMHIQIKDLFKCMDEVRREFKK